MCSPVLSNYLQTVMFVFIQILQMVMSCYHLKFANNCLLNFVNVVELTSFISCWTNYVFSHGMKKESDNN